MGIENLKIDNKIKKEEGKFNEVIDNINKRFDSIIEKIDKKK